MKKCCHMKGIRLWLLFGVVTFEILLATTILGSVKIHGLMTKAPEVTITSPKTGQQVPVSKNLLISGTSSSNRTNNCEASVIVNGIKPYQKANATGHNGPNDYSTWAYSLGFPYPPLKLGENKITAKIMCAANSHVRFNTVNVTGVNGINGTLG